MISDAAYAMSRGQSLASPVTIGVSTGHMSTDYVDVTRLNVSGGRNLYVRIKFDVAPDTDVTIALSTWLNIAPPSIPGIAFQRYLSQQPLQLSEGNVAQGSMHYLPITTQTDRVLVPIPGLEWKWLNVIYFCAGTTVGTVTADLVDTIDGNGKIYPAKNLT